jgi:membrane protease YdiL (CAAX protease family)
MGAVAVGGVNVERWRVGAWLGLVAALAALGYGSRATSGTPDDDVLYRYDTAIAGIVVYVVLLLIVLGIANGLPRDEVFALRRPRSWTRALGLALGGYVAIFIGAGLLLVAFDATEEQGLTPDEWDSSKAGAYAANFVAVALVGPIVEELVYRGAGMTFFAGFGSAIAVGVTAVAFGLGHGLLLALPALVFFGLVTGVLRARTASVYPSMVVHCGFNATSLILAVAV